MVLNRKQATEQNAQAPDRGLRDRKKALTKQAIEEAASDLFLERGFDETTVQDIAERAVVSRRTFFRYFTSKEEVLFAGEREEIRRAGGVLASRPAEESLLASLEHAITALANAYSHDRDHRLARARLITDHPSLSGAHLQLLSELEKEVVGFVGTRLDLPSDDPQVRLVAGTAVVVYRVSVDRWVRSNGREGLPDLIHTNLSRVASGSLFQHTVKGP